jgi:hypothetical protein
MWKVRQANFGSLFAKSTLSKDNTLKLFLPVSFARSAEEPPIYGAMVLSCAAINKQVSCDRAQFVFSTAARGEHNSKRSLSELGSWDGAAIAETVVPAVTPIGCS